jgi:hypothetical protein
MKHNIIKMWQSGKESGFDMLVIVFIFLVVVIFILAVLKGKPEGKRNKMNINAKKNLEIPTEIGSNSTSNHPIRDYFIKSSFNSCAGGIGQKDWVGLKPLEYVIKQGVRMLDFEIVSKNGEPCVTSSPETISNLKTAVSGTYNNLKFKEVMNFVASNAFAGVDKCPNGDDPLFINLRIKTTNTNIYPIMTTILKETFKDKFLNSGYNLNNSNNNKNLISKSLKSLKRKVIIFCHDIYKGYHNQQIPDIRELINLDGIGANGEGSKYLKVWQKGDPQSLELSHNLDSEKNYAKQAGLGIIYPNISKSSKNIDENKINKYFDSGFQFIFMNYQNYDEGLTVYEDKFNQVGSSFILKPPNLRFTVTYVELRPDPSPKVAFKTTPTRTVIPGYSPDI